MSSAEKYPVPDKFKSHDYDSFESSPWVDVVKSIVELAKYEEKRFGKLSLAVDKLLDWGIFIFGGGYLFPYNDVVEVLEKDLSSVNEEENKEK